MPLKRNTERVRGKKAVLDAQARRKYSLQRSVLIKHSCPELDFIKLIKIMLQCLNEKVACIYKEGCKERK